MEMSKFFLWRFQTFFSIQGLFWNNEATCNIQEIYGWYTGGIRVVYGGIRGIYGDIRGYTQYIVSIAYIGYTGIYGDIRGSGIYADIRGYTQYKVSIAYIGYTGIYGWYTGGIRVVYGRYTGGIRGVYGWYTLVIATSFECLTPGYIGIKKVAHLNPPWTWNPIDMKLISMKLVSQTVQHSMDLKSNSAEIDFNETGFTNIPTLHGLEIQ